LEKEKRYAKVHVAAKYYEVSKWTIYRWIEEGSVDAYKNPGGRPWFVELKEKGSDETPQIDPGPRSAVTVPTLGSGNFVTNF